MAHRMARSEETCFTQAGVFLSSPPFAYSSDALQKSCLMGSAGEDEASKEAAILGSLSLHPIKEVISVAAIEIADKQP